ncbi:MAG TPA: DNA recombination protein RmuC [Candidatus Paceibacterota bacterium]|nr:DNA recombination protein RmuC [Candidatus Pacearchaeota archaeon]HRZ50591.1 DNA recombination protein RmuC [Candidatus Paceibacterota bacterium]HSA36312.1 DNA recombination protein RmuC [Candidatus Paceibacterota bacterium]
MDNASLFLFFLVLAVLGIQTYILTRKKPEKNNDGALLMLQQQIGRIAETLDDKLSESSKAMRDHLGFNNQMLQQQFSQSARLIQDVSKKLAELDNTNKQVVGFAEQLQSLENVLKNTKQRGILGEYYLEELLKNVFSPSQYKMQYEFKDGKIVDAAIILKDKIIPIDSKFSLENYNRIIQEEDSEKKEDLEKVFCSDLKNRIDETAKYIRPNEGTLDFAFMFIPAEAIYYDLLVNKIGAMKSNTRDMIDYAVREKKVHIVSPTSFYVYLQTILQGLRSMQIEESAKEIRKRVEQLGRHLVAYDEYMKKLGGHLGTAVNAYNGASKEFSKIDKDVIRITEEVRSPAEAKQIDKPSDS